MDKNSKNTLARDYDVLREAILNDQQIDAFYNDRKVIVHNLEVNEHMYGAFISFLRLNRSLNGEEDTSL